MIEVKKLFPRIKQGLILVITGNGKGKTTAALGLAFRAAGAELRTIIVQFMKGQRYSELDSVRHFGGLVVIEQYGSTTFCRPDDESIEEHYRLARKALARAKEVLADGSYSLVILDEIVTSSLFKLVTIDEILELIRLKPENKELVITGRGATPELIEACDLVTEMKEIKHYYNVGVNARTGIEN